MSIKPNGEICGMPRKYGPGVSQGAGLADGHVASGSAEHINSTYGWADINFTTGVTIIRQWPAFLKGVYGGATFFSLPKTEITR